MAGFDSGKAVLDEWLKKRALANEASTSRTYVVAARAASHPAEVVAYYSLATGSVTRADLPRTMRRNSPDPVPAMLLARLAVDRRHHGAGLGRAMLREAISRTIEISRSAGVRLLIVHPIDAEAAGFYSRFGFEPLGGGAAAMYLPIETLLAAL